MTERTETTPKDDDQAERLCNCIRCTRARLGRPPFNESISHKIVRAQNLHAKGHCTQGVS
jgi:hypothetical protein